MKVKELVGEALEALERLRDAMLAVPADVEHRKLMLMACADVRERLLKALAA